MSPDRGVQAADAETIAFDEFRTGLPHGRFRVIVDPARVRPFVVHRTHATQLALALVGPGIGAALAGHAWPGAVLVAAGIALRWSVRAHAARILLHLATQVPSVYEHATAQGVMEVRRAA